MNAALQHITSFLSFRKVWLLSLSLVPFVSYSLHFGTFYINGRCTNGTQGCASSHDTEEETLFMFTIVTSRWGKKQKKKKKRRTIYVPSRPPIPAVGLEVDIDL